MRILNLDYQTMQLMSYEGAGNKTPVLDLSPWVDSATVTPLEVRNILEGDLTFRSWLQQEGKKLKADSVMIYYRSHQGDYDFVTFVGEPTADIHAPFSDMCGNGIRALALHILLDEDDDQQKEAFMRDGISIWAGEPRTISVETVMPGSGKGMFRVELGPFQSSVDHMNVFVNTLLFPSIADFSAVRMNGQMRQVSGMLMGYGFNGNDSGEPHAVLLVRSEDLPDMAPHIRENIDRNISMDSIRKVACDIGSYVTFNTSIFPRGINFSFGIVDKNKIYMSTHERNLLPSQSECFEDQNINGFCHCNTLACGTGGAAAVNIAHLQGLVEGSEIVTIHPGGVLDYVIGEKGTVMIGPARRIS